MDKEVERRLGELEERLASSVLPDLVAQPELIQVPEPLVHVCSLC